LWVLLVSGGPSNCRAGVGDCGRRSKVHRGESRIKDKLVDG